MNIARIKVANGTINYGNISVANHIDMFPSDSIGGHNKDFKASRSLKIHLVDGDVIETDIDDDKKIFRNGRPTVKAWINKNNAKLGDFICIDKIDDYSYKVWLENQSSESLVSPITTTVEKILQPSQYDKEQNSMNTILYGPPGTGKTYSTTLRAVQICIPGWHADANEEEIKAKYEELREEGRISFITFHQSYGYEDFIEGLRPELKDGQIHYEVRLGVFRKACKAAELSTENHVLIIDEINRANISKVFGELITLLESDKRAGETNAITLKLPSSGDSFSVPANLYVIGTMNTADRSIALLDTALRRRFEFEELQPDYTKLSTVEGIDLGAMLEAINKRIEFLYDRDHTIGHAYLMSVKTIAELDTVFRRKIVPLLQEYFYENWAKVREALNDKDELFISVINEVPQGLEGYEDRPRYKMKDSFSSDAYRKIYIKP